MFRPDLKAIRWICLSCSRIDVFLSLPLLEYLCLNNIFEWRDPGWAKLEFHPKLQTLCLRFEPTCWGSCRSYNSLFRLPQLAFIQLPLPQCEEIQKVQCLDLASSYHRGDSIYTMCLVKNFQRLTYFIQSRDVTIAFFNFQACCLSTREFSYLAALRA